MEEKYDEGEEGEEGEGGKKEEEEEGEEEQTMNLYDFLKSRYEKNANPSRVHGHGHQPSQSKVGGPSSRPAVGPEFRRPLGPT